MQRRFFYVYLTTAITALLWLTIHAGCANIIPPTGGPRDSTAPILLSVTPPDSTTNFTGSRITFTFDEYIADLKDIQNNLLFTPLFDIVPEVIVRAKTVTVRLRDSLRPNTTYTFNFGNAIADVNESNSIKNFTYLFSTGPRLDSLTLSGRVLIAETGLPDSTLTVLLHENLADTAVKTVRPTYAARVNAQGDFLFKNLPRRTFAIYALGNAGTIRRYQSTTEFFAFADSTVQSGQSRQVTLFAYKETTPASTATPAPNAPTLRTGGNSNRRLQFNPNTTNLLGLTDSFTLTFASVLKTLDTTLISLSADSSYQPVPFRTRLDSARRVLTVQANWKEGTPYNLILAKDFAEDSAGRKLLKTDTLRFTTKKRSDYSQVSIKLRGVTAGQKPVLQFVQNNAVVFSAPIGSGTFRSTLFNPGDYELRVLYDANGNGQWDAGRFFTYKRQPEKVVPIDRRLSIKTGWENDFDLTMPEGK